VLGTDRTAQVKKDAWSGGALPPASNPAAARLRTRRSSPKSVLRGSFRPVLVSGVISALRVIHLGSRLGSGRSVAARVATAMVLRGEVTGVHTFVCFRALLRAQTGQGGSANRGIATGALHRGHGAGEQARP